MARKTNVEANAEMKANEPKKTRIIRGKLVEIIDKTPEQRRDNFVATINHELNRVGEWSAKLAKHTTGTTYPLSDKAIDAIVAQYDAYGVVFHAEIERFKNKGNKTEAVGIVSTSDIAE